VTTPRRGQLFHFTHIDNVPTIATEGLFCDCEAVSRSLPKTDVGQQDIKAQRRRRRVPVWPGGVVTDYVPFYFAARSPMLYKIDKGEVPTYDGGQDGVVYLVTDVHTIVEQPSQFVFTDRNAVSDYARFADGIDLLNSFVDWSIMDARYRYNTPTEPDRRSRRMAEFLVHRRVPWDAFIEVAARTGEDAAKAQASLARVGADLVVRVRPGWYF
jgi:hypothetical protein